MSESIKANNAVLRTGILITGVYIGLAFVCVCYVMSII